MKNYFSVKILNFVAIKSFAGVQNQKYGRVNCIKKIHNKGVSISLRYKTREDGATCTIFAPYDCDNNCPFCINKEEYCDTSNFSLPKILKKIKMIDKCTPQCDFVITGGEPFANLESLDKIISAIPDTHRLFINTTFPCKTPSQVIDNYNLVKKYLSRITCLNISRHITPIVNECKDSIIAQLPCNKRINCMLFNNCSNSQIVKFVNRWSKFDIPIQFRFDYTLTTPDNLYDESEDKILKRLKSEFHFLFLEGCRIRNNYIFEYRGNGKKVARISYHKTLPFSTVIEKSAEDGLEYTILYDILIKQDGSLHSDWDQTKLDFEKYKNATLEPDDIHVIK